MDFKNVNINDYCLNLDLHKSMFFIDMLKDTYEFTLKGDRIEIFKKLKNGISEPITRKELIYSIQVEMVEKYEYSSIKRKTLKDVVHYGKYPCVGQHLEKLVQSRFLLIAEGKDASGEFHQFNVKLLIIMFYGLFETVDSIHKAIDNMVYLEKYLNKKEESTDEEESDEESSGEEESDEESSGEEESDEESSGEEEQVGPQKTLEELKMESIRMLRKQISGDY